MILFTIVFAVLLAVLLVFQALWEYLIGFFVVCLVLLILMIWIVKIKRGSSMKEVFRNLDTSQSSEMLLETILKRVKGVYYDSNSALKSDAVVFSKTGIYLFSINKAKNILRGNVEDSHLIDFVQVSDKFIPNSFQDLLNDEQLLSSILGDVPIYKVVVLNNRVVCEIIYSKAFYVWRFKELFYQLQRSIKEKEIFDTEQLKQLYQKWLLHCKEK